METKGGSEVHEHSHELKAGGEVHEHSPQHSHDQSANPTLEDNCCGDRSGFIKADLLKPFKSISLLSLPFGHLQVESVLLSDTQKFNRILPVHIISSPVYLSTQRVRI